MEKRQFLKRFGQAALLGTLMPFEAGAASLSVPVEPYPFEDEEAFWKRIRMDYALKPDYINLENGYYNFVPTPILNKYMEHIRRVNYEGSYYMRTEQWENKDKVAERLAGLLNCSAEEMMITRNTTESLRSRNWRLPLEKRRRGRFCCSGLRGDEESFPANGKALWDGVQGNFYSQPSRF